MLEGRRPLRDELRARLVTVQGESDEVAREIGALRGALTAAEQVLARREEIAAGVAALAAAQAEHERLEGLSAAYEALQEQRRDHAAALRQAESHIRTEMQIANSRLDELRERAARRPALVAELQHLGAQLDGFAALDQELEAARRKRAELNERTQAAHELQLRRKDLDGQIKLKHDSLVGTREEHKRRIRDADEQLRDEARWRADLVRMRDERARLEGDSARVEELRQTEHEAVERAGGLRAACTSIKAQGDEINKKLALIGADTQACPLCGSELGHDGIVHIEAEYNHQRADLRSQYSAAKREADAIDMQLKELPRGSLGSKAICGRPRSYGGARSRINAPSPTSTYSS
jgi:exonuclease SbcC